MFPAHPALRRTGLGVAAGAAAGGLVALQGLEGWSVVRTAALILTPVPLVLASVRGRGLTIAVSLAVLALVVAVSPVGRITSPWGVAVAYGSVVAFVLLVIRVLPAFTVIVCSGVILSTSLAGLHLTLVARANGHSVAVEYQDLLTAAEADLRNAVSMAEADAEQRQQLEATIPVVQRLLPALAIGEYVSSLALATWTSLFALRRLRLAEVPRANFGAWRLPEWSVFGFILPAVGLLLGLWLQQAALVTVTANVLAVVIGVYLLQGCAIVHAFLRRLGTRPMVEAFCFLSILLLIPPLLLAVVVAGLFDFLVDFRGRWIPTAPCAPDERSDG